MNSSHYGLKQQTSMKKSFILQQYNNQALGNSRDRCSLSKRSSFNIANQYGNTVDFPKTPKQNQSLPYTMQSYPILNQHCHQSSYANNHNYHQLPPQNSVYVNKMNSCVKINGVDNRYDVTYPRN